MLTLKPKTAVKIEVVGLIFVLLSLGWQVFIEEPVAEIYAEAREYETNERLELLWAYLKNLRDELVEQRPPSSRDYNYLQGRWNQLPGQEDAVARQADVARYVRIAFFLLGSVMVTVGRYSELRERVSGTQAK